MYFSFRAQLPDICHSSFSLWMCFGEAWDRHREGHLTLGSRSLFCPQEYFRELFAGNFFSTRTWQKEITWIRKRIILPAVNMLSWGLVDFFVLWKAFSIVCLQKRDYKKWNVVLYRTEMHLSLCCLFPTTPQTLCRRKQQVWAENQQQNLTLVWLEKPIGEILDHTLMGESSPGQWFLPNSSKACLDRLKNRTACYI